MLIFPDPNVETEYTDPNGSVWQFNGTGWVRQCDCDGSGGGDGGDNGSGDPYWDHVKCQMQFEGGFASDVGSTAYTLEEDNNAAVTDDRAKHGLFSMYCESQQGGITTKFKDGDFFNSAWTVEAWYRPKTSLTKIWLLGMDDGNSNREGFRLFQTSYKLTLQVREPSNNTNFIDVATSRAITSNGWSHIAISYDGARFRVFIDGVRALDEIYTGKAFTHADFKLAGRHTADWGTSTGVKAQGWFDDFRVTSACRYTADFEPPGELPQSAFAYFDKEVVEIDQKDSNDADLTNDVTIEES